MSVVAVPYEDFQTVAQAFVADGGPWRVSFARPSDYAQCPLTKASWCDPGGYCLQCTVLPPDVAARYEITYSTNISVNMVPYGSATVLDYSWEFWPVYLGSNITAGSQFPILSAVGDQTFTDTQIAQDFVQFLGVNDSGDHSWGSTPKVSHTGTMSVTRGGSDGARAYIPLTIQYVFTPGGHTEYFNHFTKGIGFRITTPLQTASPPASTNASPPSTSTSSPPSASTSSPDVSSTAPQSKISSGAVAGAVIGSIAFLLLIIGLVFYLRRRSRRSNSVPVEPYGKPESFSVAAKYPLDEPPRTSGVNSTLSGPSNSTVPFSIPVPSFSPRVANSTPSGVQEVGGSTVMSDNSSLHEPPPPMYEIARPYVAPRPSTSTPPALAAFATAHRDLISEDLEARLASAGYVPTDNPDHLSEEEWKSLHNVTKLELIRLRSLYNSEGPRTGTQVKPRR